MQPNAPHDVPLACRCGSLRGVAHEVSRASSNRAVCMCDDCQAYAHFLGRADVLDANGGTDIFPVAPCNLELSQGMQHLKCMRLSNRGMLRWYASCCNTPIANSLASSKVPFAGVHAVLCGAVGAARDELLGPIRARSMAKFGIAPLPADAHPGAPLGFLLRTARFLLVGLITRQHSPSPFFDAAGKPVVDVRVLTAAERGALGAVR